MNMENKKHLSEVGLDNNEVIYVENDLGKWVKTTVGEELRREEEDDKNAEVIINQEPEKNKRFLFGFRKN